jgi:hypothetical protein
MSKNEKEIMEELEVQSRELYAAIAVPPVAVPEIAAEPVVAALAEATKEIYAKMPPVGLVAAAGSGRASYALVDYSFTSTSRVLWAYAENKWRYKVISNTEVAGIAKLIMEATLLDVSWSDSNLTFVRCWKKY